MENQKSSSLEMEIEDEPPSSLGNLNLKSKTKTVKSLRPFLREFGLFFVIEKPTDSKRDNACWIEIVQDIDACRELWKEFEPPQTFFDTWEFRLAFYQAYQHKPYFMVLRNRKEILAMLPLWYEKEKKKYFWFGSWWQEEVRFFAKKPEYIIPLIHQAPSPLLLNAITQESINPIKEQIQFKADESKYVLHLKNFKNHEDYLMTLKKNTRRNLRKDRNRMEKLNPEIIIDNFSDIEELIKTAKKRFRDKNDEADWEDPRREQTFRNVIKLAGSSYQTRMITLRVGNKIAGVDLITLFRDTYLTLKCGYNIGEFSGAGNYMNLIEIDDAINLRMKKIDFLQNNYRWKSAFFEPVPLFLYEKQ